MGGYGVICGGCSVVDPSDCLTSAKDNQPRDERWKLWQSQDNGISGFGLRLCLPLNLPDCEASYSNGILKVNGIEYPMVYVSGGSFMMGSDDSEALFDEKPVHRVTLSSYRIGKYEVTQDLWEAVMGSNPSCFKGSRKPVERVSWYDCLTFIRKLNSLTGQNFKLPTEAQWEFAARGGNSSNGYKYSGSNYIDNVGWYGDNSGNTTHNVGTKSPNELGIYDMSGNVWEWCCDWYGGYSSSSQTNPEGLSLGYRRICRGGSWLSCHQVYNRYHLPPDQWGRVYGLRLCL
ncbi:MAG: formylglycine-generating enzyme family protein [Bacteroidales bacterium]|nr:formylglycine-generating enzyme family protein [Bacteroidales bacterium]